MRSRSLRSCLFWGPSLHSPRPCQRTVWRGSLRASPQTGKPPPLPAQRALAQTNQQLRGVSETFASSSAVRPTEVGLMWKVGEYSVAGGGRDALSRNARKGGMAFGAHEPPRTRRRPRPCRANPHCGGAPTNAALKGGIPESVSSRSTAESKIIRIIRRNVL